jgi:ribosomal protein S27E
MNNWLRRAEISRGMIVTLGVLVLVAGVFWTYKCRSKSSDIEQATLRYKSYNITCSECGLLPDKIPAEKVKEMNADTKNGKLKCPKCGKYTAMWGRPRVQKGDQGESGGDEQGGENP